MRAALFAGALAALAACATPPKPVPPPAEVSQVVHNLSPFDLDDCFHNPVEVPRPANREGLSGLLAAALPEVRECLVDPAHRGPAEATRLKLRTMVDAEGAVHTVESDNLTGAGTACIEQALRARASIDPLEGAIAEAELELAHAVGRDPGVVFGLNEASDVVARLRLALPGWCDCFEPFRTRAPRSFTGELRQPEGATSATAAFPQTGDEGAGRTQACLVDKVSALELPALGGTLRTGWPVLLVHSGAPDALPEGSEDGLAIAHLDALRVRRHAEVALALAARQNAAAAWKAAAARVKGKPKPAVLKDLKARCQTLLVADDLWIAALEAAHEAAARLAAREPEASGALVSSAAEAVEEGRRVRAQDAASCP